MTASRTLMGKTRDGAKTYGLQRNSIYAPPHHERIEVNLKKSLFFSNILHVVFGVLRANGSWGFGVKKG